MLEILWIAAVVIGLLLFAWLAFSASADDEEEG
jgi:hypothetical protein